HAEPAGAGDGEAGNTLREEIGGRLGRSVGGAIDDGEGGALGAAWAGHDEHLREGGGNGQEGELLKGELARRHLDLLDRRRVAGRGDTDGMRAGLETEQDEAAIA